MPKTRTLPDGTVVTTYDRGEEPWERRDKHPGEIHSRDDSSVIVDTENLDQAAAGLTSAATAITRAANRIDPSKSADDKRFKTGGFRSLGHFAHVVMRAGRPDGGEPHSLVGMSNWRSLVSRVTQLQRSTIPWKERSTGLNEAADSDGGVLVPTEFSKGVWKRSSDEFNNFLSRTTVYPIIGNTYEIPADAEVSRVNGSRQGGIQSYWNAEGVQYTGSKPTFRKVELKLKKLTVLVYVTDETFEDSAGALDTFLDASAAEEFAFRINSDLVAGTGAGRIAGMTTATARITRAAVGGQGAGTIVAENVDSMWACRHAPNERKYVWLYNQELDQQLERMAYTTGNNSGQPVLIPAGMSGYDYPTLKGRELLNCEQCSIPGTEGDLILWDPTQNATAIKSTGVKKEVSMYLRFDYGETVFRFSIRVDSQPAWSNSITPFKGANPRSPVVTLSSTRT